MTDSVNRAGAASIVDRVEGWGHTAGSDSARKDNTVWTGSITATDASAEATATRVARQRRLRQDGNPTNTPDTDDRTRGLGGTFDPTDSADGGYGVKDWEVSAATVGTDYDIELSGSNTNYSTSDAEHGASNRSAKALPTSDLVEPGIETVGSIVDRTSGWGHTSGSQSDRHD